MTKPIPEGFSTVTPYLIAENGDRLITFASEAFGASVVSCLRHKDGSVWNAELQIGSSKVLVAQAHGGQKPFPAFLYLYVDDTDAAYDAAVEAGGQSLMEPGDQFYGDRNAGIMDEEGNVWWIATRIENVDPEEMKERAAKFENQQ